MDKPTMEELRGAFHSAIDTARSNKVLFKCERCGGEEWITKQASAKKRFCIMCRRIVENERSRAFREDRRERKARKTKRRESQIDNIAAAARKAGMSYGKYVALKGAGML